MVRSRLEQTRLGTKVTLQLAIISICTCWSLAMSACNQSVDPCSALSVGWVCCGGVPRESSTGFCCGNKWYDHIGWGRDICCGGAVFTQADGLCCQGTWHIGANAGFECCGSGVLHVDDIEHQCCYNHDIQPSGQECILVLR